MTSIVNILYGFGPWNWFILATALFLLETIIPGVHFVWFSVAAALVGIAAIGLTELGPEAASYFGWQAQIIVFALTAMVTVFWVRRYAGPLASKSDLPNLNERSAQYIGRSVQVAEAISGGRGKVRIGDTLWIAEGPDVAAGQTMTVVAAKGSVLVVAHDAA